MSEKKYHCDDCKKELSVSLVRLQRMINYSYDVKLQNNKLLKFLKDIVKHNKCSPIKAMLLLKDLGEL